MIAPALFTTWFFLCAGAAADPVREPHPLAPSIPVLTKDEEKRIERIIERFVQFDIGKLPKAEGSKALADFNRLGPEAIFLLVEAFNQAANMEHSCPSVIIGRKIASILNASEDTELLQYAKENIGAGVTVRRHMGTVQDLKLAAQLRRSAVQRRLTLAGKASPQVPRTMTTADLLSAAGSERGAKLKLVLTELEKRDHPRILDTLALAAGSYDKDVQQLAGTLLVKNLSRQSAGEVKTQLKAERAEVRAAAALVVGTQKLPLVGELIDLLADPEPPVQKAAHQALVQLNRGTDLGPRPEASAEDRAAAAERWRAWWARENKAAR